MSAWTRLLAASSLAIGSAWELITHPKTGGGGTVLTDGPACLIADNPDVCLIAESDATQLMADDAQTFLVAADAEAAILIAGPATQLTRA